MVGNVIQSRALTNNDYPTAAALSFIMMAAILVAVVLFFPNLPFAHANVLTIVALLYGYWFAMTVLPVPESGAMGQLMLGDKGGNLALATGP